MDIIDGLDWLVGRIFHGEMHKFYFDSVGFSGMQVEAILRQYHIRIWGRDMTNPKMLGFTVKKSQAVFAEYILCRVGIPVLSKLIVPSHYDLMMRSMATGGSLPPAWGKADRPHTFVDFVTTGMDKVLGSSGARRKQIRSKMKAQEGLRRK